MSLRVVASTLVAGRIRSVRCHHPFVDSRITVASSISSNSSSWASTIITRAADVGGRSTIVLRGRSIPNPCSVRTITTKFGKSKDNKMDRAIRKHKEMESVMGESSAAPTATSEATSSSRSTVYSSSKEEYLVEQYRLNRFRQALINACLSFFTVILAVQGVKNANACRKAEQDCETVQELLDEERRLLQSLLNDPDALASPVTTQILQRINNNEQQSSEESSASATARSSSWWSTSNTKEPGKTSTTTTEDQRILQHDVQQIIIEGLKERIGRIVMTPEERDKNDLNQLSSAAADVEVVGPDAATVVVTAATTDDEDILLDKTSHDERGQEEETRTTIKKRVYAF